MSPDRSPRLDVVVPVYNEANELRASILTLHSTLSRTFSELTWRITIADNASTDGTAEIAQTLAEVLPGVRVLRLAEKGRGRALALAWLSSPADVVAYVDVDLSTDLRALAPLVAPLLSGHSDVAIGSRLLPASRIIRGSKREVLSRGYNLLLHVALGVTFSDAQCGFKAMTREAARAVLPHVRDLQWFFDTELLAISERAGLRIAEVPVDWQDDPRSTVDIGSTIRQDLAGIVRLMRSFASRRIPVDRMYEQIGRKPLGRRVPILPQLIRFAAVGFASTLLFTVLYLALQEFLPAQVADFAALALAALVNTAVNRRVTFGVRDPSTLLRHLLRGMLVFLATWGLTSAALGLAAVLEPRPDAWRDVLLLTAANGIATVLKFVAFRLLFRPRRDAWTRSTERTSRQELLEV